MSRVFALDLHQAADANAPAIADAASFAAGLRRLAEPEREAIRGLSGVARPRQAGFAASLGALAGAGALAGRQINRDDLAVITVGWRLHIPISWAFAERALEAGAGLVNPLRFPHLLPSACAVTIAAALGGHGPAFGLEAAAAPVATAVGQAEALCTAGLCRSALVIAALDGAIFTDWAEAPWSYWPDRIDGAFAVLVGVDPALDAGADRSVAALDRFLAELCAVAPKPGEGET